LRQTHSILYIDVDSLIPVRGSLIPGLDEFSAALDHAGIPAVWLTSRTRLQMDEPRRKLAHSHPFIAEDGCGVFLPEGYFHLRPQTSPSHPQKAPTVRLGRFTCLPIAEPQPAASDALEALSAETGLSVVPLRSLPSRELAQNLALPSREADLARQRDFDELFFFAGGTAEDAAAFLSAGERRNIQLRQRGVLWSLAVGANIRRCIRELSKLYDRALRSHARSVALVTPSSSSALFEACDHAILLRDVAKSHPGDDQSQNSSSVLKVMELSLNSSDGWGQILAALTKRR